MGVLLPTVRHVFIENLIVVDVLAAKDRPDRHSLAFELVVESLEAMTLIHTAPKARCTQVNISNTFISSTHLPLQLQSVE